MPTVADLYAKATADLLSQIRLNRDAIGFASNIDPTPASPLDTAAESTIDGWIRCADGRTLWEYATGAPR